MIHHVQLACPAGSEEASRAYYVGLLGLAELAKPPVLATRGGCWFAGHGIELHLGVETPFAPARKAHPALGRPDLDTLAARLTAAGYPVIWGTDEVPGMVRFHTEDCHGNRIEFVEADPRQ